MTLTGWVIVAIVAAAGVALAVVMFDFRRRNRHIAACFAAAPDAALLHICSMIEGLGELPSEGYVLARTNATATDAGTVIVIPDGPVDFPWAGRVVEARRGSNGIELGFVPAGDGSRSRGRQLRALRVPRSADSGGKARNLFSPARLMRAAPSLRAALEALCPRHPVELLGYMLSFGGSSFQFDPVDQVRIGTRPAWVQDPEIPVCGRCRKRMHLVLQLPGFAVSERAGSTHCFLMGCRAHPDETSVVVQHT